MADVKNINRVLVLEKFNEAENIEVGKKICQGSLTLALNFAENESGNFDYRKVDIDGLEVKSFEEFKERFSPDIYYAIKSGESGDYFEYSMDKDSLAGAQKMKFDKVPFFKAALDLYQKKSVAGKANYEFDYSCFSSLLSPAETLKEIKEKRKELNSAMRLALEAKDSHNSALEKKYRRQTDKIVKEAVEKFQNPAALLALNIADMEVKLGLVDHGNSNADDKEKTTSLSTYALDFNDNGDIVKKRIAVHEVNNENYGKTLSIEDRANKQVMRSFLQELTGSREINDNLSFNNQLIVSAYTVKNELVEQNDDKEKKEQLKKRYDHFKAVYKSSQDGLLKAVNGMIEKMLDVKALFDNAGGNISVIIANCTADDIVSSEKNISRFKEFMVNINGNIDQKIWFSVLPQIDDEDLVNRENAGVTYFDELKEENGSFAEDDDVIEAEFTPLDDAPVNDDNYVYDESSDDWDDDDSDEKKIVKLISLDTAKQLIGIFAEAKCMTFFGYKGCEKTGFGCMDKKRLEEYKSKLNGINSRYAVFAYPNFTLMSAMDAGDIEIAKGNRIQNPGLFLDAPYIAAGLTLKSLNSDILKKLHFDVDLDLLPFPCVRFDFEDSSDDYKNRYEVKSNMNCEQLLKYSKDLLDEAEKEPFGFFFDSYGFYKGQKVGNAFVKSARNLEREKDNRIFATLVKDFIFLEISDGSIAFSTKKIDEYKSKKKWSRKPDCINNPFRKDEFFDYKEFNGKIKPFVKFNSSDEDDTFDDIEVTNE